MTWLARAVDLVAEYEGFRPRPYRCPAGVWTIGYGHVIRDRAGRTVDAATAQRLHPTPWTREQARAVLRDDLRHVEHALREALGDVRLSGRQRAAIVSWAYNVGLGAARRSTLLRLVRAGRLAAAAAEFRRWVWARDPRTGERRILPGLVRRRAAEAALFRGGEDEHGG